ncbi:CPBP family intramembrane glutamic endopeptidase [Kurthia huakuii]|uniref:CPBP family intramembrane glutamic endopeptidase n=1 Tax=Kurthia huakuii TaxID=1421019 RepID=UPI000497787F|nr:CPBP family intramembrane glutamic endopeptidase [Kurthia huakuii]MBM7698490.1 membrane protease YdiL (CAAX protease family) [Kurthia huakuii]
MRRYHVIFVLSLLAVFALMTVSFQNPPLFWYTYTFSMLLCVAFSKTFSEVFDELSTTKYLLLGIPSGVIGYFLILGIYELLPQQATTNVQQFLTQFSPQSLFEYVLLILIIAVAEELYWRGFVQQYLKQFLRTTLAIIVASLAFAIPLMLNGFYMPSIAAFFSGIVIGFIYERTKSMPVIILIHIVIVTLLFLLLPLY